MTPELLNKALQQQLPDHLAEVLIPAVTWRVASKRCTAIVPNPVWESLFREYAFDACNTLCNEAQMTLVLRSRLDPSSGETVRGHMSLDGFLQDPGNQFAFASSKGILDAPGILHNPLFIHGPSGCGKTHLLTAIAEEYKQLLGTEAVVELSGTQFVGRDAQILADRHESDLRRRLGAAAVICFDQVDALADRQMAQEELYLLINHCLDQGQQLVFTAQVPPHVLEACEDRLATRLAWGLTVAIDPPQAETRLALLRRLAGPDLEDTPARDLEVLIDTQALDMHQVSRLAERFRSGERIVASRSNASFDRIIAAVAEEFGVRPGDISGKHRHRQVVQARQAALLIGRRLTDYSLAALGGMVGGRDHSTVLYSLRMAETRVGDEVDYAELINRLSRQILGANE